MPTRRPLFNERARAESFGAVAANYDRYRPTYPDALVDDLVAMRPRAVVDVGCGTGKAAALLAGRGLDVLGVEVDPMMAEVARSHGIPVEEASFEDWDAAGRSFDLLISGQAWHWVDPYRGVPKAAQVLRPGGAAALFWNHDRVSADTERALRAVYAQVAPELIVDQPDAGSDRPELEPFASSDLFTAVGVRRYPWQRHFTADEWVGVCLTYSNHLLLPADRRAALAAALHEAVTRLGGVVADYETYLVLARRVG